MQKEQSTNNVFLYSTTVVGYYSGTVEKHKSWNGLWFVYLLWQSTVFTNLDAKLPSQNTKNTTEIKGTDSVIFKYRSVSATR